MVFTLNTVPLVEVSFAVYHTLTIAFIVSFYLNSFVSEIVAVT